MPIYILFRSLTSAQRGARLLEREGIRARLGRAPSQVTDNGCAYALRLDGSGLSEAIEALDSAGIRRGRVFRPEGAGLYREVTV